MMFDPDNQNITTCIINNLYSMCSFIIVRIIDPHLAGNFNILRVVTLHPHGGGILFTHSETHAAPAQQIEPYSPLTDAAPSFLS